MKNTQYTTSPGVRQLRREDEFFVTKKAEFRLPAKPRSYATNYSYVLKHKINKKVLALIDGLNLLDRAGFHVKQMS
jgi:hypothetical protein